MYNHQKLEKKWQEFWQENKIYKVEEDKAKDRYYVLDMFPYPSGVGLHVGHPRGYIATDVMARYKMLNGFNVLHPMGWDAFGLPAENYALKNKTHPRESTATNIANYRRQLGLLGFTYDWNREINTTDPAYYHWTQWAFIQMFKQGLVYESSEPINWCPTCRTGLANEDVEDGRCERCDTLVEKKPLRQWKIKITDYAERLLDGLNKLDDWEESIKEMQRNWIGRSEGATVKFPIANFQFPNKSQTDSIPASLEETVIPAQAGIQAVEKNEILKQVQDDGYQTQDDGYFEVFTTRPDTIFGATYLVLCPEHEAISNFQFPISNWEDVQKYIKKTRNKSDLERTDLNKNKTGVELKGVKAVNPATNEEIPVWVADYVLPNYGTGAIMAVPAHDERDFEFARKYDLPIKWVVIPHSLTYLDANKFSITLNYPQDELKILDKIEDINGGMVYSGFGVAIKSDFLNGLDADEAKTKIIAWLEEKNFGQRKIQYRLKDWVFSRQRYWGEPIPLIHCDKCGVVPVPDNELPLRLPEVASYEPSGTGESPLANIADWVNTTCPKCGGVARRETNTMPQWAGSSWYYLRYADPHNDQALINQDKEKYWFSPTADNKLGGVDCYVGGAEHASRHLIYARFWHKFLFDIGVVSTDEPFAKLRHVGLILSEDGRKMSKRWNNVINPDNVVVSHGADALRVYEMFMGPFGEPIAWNTNGLSGVRKFLEKVYKLKDKLCHQEESSDQATLKSVDKNNEIATPPGADCNDSVKNLLHKTIKKVGEDIEAFKFNTAISALMILVNKFSEQTTIENGDFSKLLLILAPFAPHLSEELWQEKVSGESILAQPWPKFDPTLAKDEVVSLVVQINGKLRDTLVVSPEIEENEAKDLALVSAKVKIWTDGKNIEKIIYIKGRLINIVLK